MKRKNTLQDYAQAEFVDLVKAIELADGPSRQKLVCHFESIVDLPDPVVVLTNPQQGPSRNSLPTPEYVTAYVKLQHNQQGRRAFRDDPLPMCEVGSRLSPEASAIKASTLSQASAELVIATLDASARAVEKALEDFGTLLQRRTVERHAGIKVTEDGGLVSGLEIARTEVEEACDCFASHQPKMDACWIEVERDRLASSHDGYMQAALFERVSQARDAFAARLARHAKRRQELQRKAASLLANEQQ
ncbi:bacteriocin immunity protein [Pseudomonas wadenswilerensis]